jgi:hypothetical protein
MVQKRLRQYNQRLKNFAFLMDFDVMAGEGDGKEKMRLQLQVMT